MTTRDQHNEATPPLEQVEPATPVTDREAERADSSIAPTGVKRTNRIDHSRSRNGGRPDGRGTAHAGSRFHIESNRARRSRLAARPYRIGDHRYETAGGMADPTRSGTESSTDRPLFADDELSELRARWDNVQTGFVDDPPDCVQKADGLVSDVVEQLTNGFTEARSRLEQQWGRGEEASTEDLRVALKRYREFFDRLLAV